LHVLEGTINAGGASADALAPPPTDWSTPVDPAAFCLPDENGVGAPYWRADFPQTFSEAAHALSPALERRVLVEGLLFRTRQILDDLCDGPPSRLLLSGGLTHDSGVPAALASLVDAPLEVVLEPETTLLGAARLAAAETAATPVATRGVAALPGADLRSRFAAWEDWLASVGLSRA